MSLFEWHEEGPPRLLMADLDLRVIDVGSGKLIQHLIIDPSVDYQGSSRSIL
ncbi:MAG: hypothetical protein ACYCSF_06915 [Acidimicrobiales bacterium]